MGGIYLHIPFCQRRCSYCDFFSTTQSHRKEAYIQALLREMAVRSNELITPVQTIYLGGGTPSQLTIEQLRTLLQGLQQHFNTTQVQECTLEANPDDLTPEYLAALRQMGFNRLSMGVQSFSDSYLQLMNRRHTAQEAKDAFYNARQAGFDNISIDLMYGLPNQTRQDWQRTLDTAMQLRPEHLSAYHLTYEEGTPMYRLLDQAVDEEVSNEFFWLLKDTLQQAGYEHYEISNFAQPGYRSQHNSNYWKGVAYVGLGAGAHSYDGQSVRSWNPDNLELYIQGIYEREGEHLTPQDQYNELVMTRLRTCEGVPEQAIPDALRKQWNIRVDKWLKESYLERCNNFVRLTKKGIFVSDSIIRDLFD